MRRPSLRRLAALPIVPALLACDPARPGELDGPAESRVRFLIVFGEVDGDLPRTAPPPLMQVSAFAGRGVLREHAQADQANHCHSVAANPCGFWVPRNAPVTLMAVDSPGRVEGPPSPADTSEARAEVQAAVEFDRFAHRDLSPMSCRDFVSPSRGVCVITAPTDTVVVALFRRMRRVIVNLAGAGGLDLTITAPPALGFDPVPEANPLARAYSLPELVTAGPATVYALWLPAEARITLEARPVPGGAAGFRRWLGCDGEGAVCRLDGRQRASVTAEFEVWDCTAAGLGHAATPLDPRCIRR